MVLPSGEVETAQTTPAQHCSPRRSGWFFHPGTLKLQDADGVPAGNPGSGWFFHPGKLKLVLNGALNLHLPVSSGWFFHPGKLKPAVYPLGGICPELVPDGSSIRGS